MTTNGTTTRPNTREMSGEVLTEAARRMFPVIAGRVLTAVADRAVDRIDQVAGRLDERRTGGGASDASDAAGADDLDDDTEDTDDDEGQGTGGGRMGAAFAFLVEQARQLLALVVRLAAQAAEMLRRATERLRARRAPEGIDEAPAPEEIAAPEDLEDDELDDTDDELEDADDAEYVDDDAAAEYADDEADDDEIADDEIADDDAVAEYDEDDETEERATVRA